MLAIRRMFAPFLVSNPPQWHSFPFVRRRQSAFAPKRGLPANNWHLRIEFPRQLQPIHSFPSGDCSECVHKPSDSLSDTQMRRVADSAHRKQGPTIRRRGKRLPYVRSETNCANCPAGAACPPYTWCRVLRAMLFLQRTNVPYNDMHCPLVG